ncbi:MAG: hypothetical protein LAO79_06855 [Acidobacteriia bacterium]|nr:hypothetical protein [Terriglobia bacterium]
MWPLALLLVAIGAPLAPAQRALSIDDLKEIVRQIGDRAMNYTKGLPDFVCTQATHRFVDYTATGEHWEPQDTIEQQLTYFDGHEKYKLLTIDGRAAGAGNKLKAGVTSSGEFASMLDQIFDPSVAATFRWNRFDKLRGRPVYVFSFQVEASRSHATIGVSGTLIETAYHGLIFADRDTKLVTRVEMQADPPQDFPMRDISHVLDYGLVPVAGEEYTLPLHSEMRARVPESLLRDGKKRVQAREVLTRNEVDFLLYRKYGAQAAIKFGSDDPPKK